MKRKKSKILVFIMLFVTFSAQLFGAYRAPEVGRLFYWMMAPDLLSLSMGYMGTENPSGVVVNPASQASVQNFKFQVSAGVAPAFANPNFKDALDFFAPFIINAGFVIPSRYGNFTVYANYLNMSNESWAAQGLYELGAGQNTDDLKIGKTGSLYVGYSKDYSDTVAVGFSGSLKFSYNPLVSEDKRFDIGAAVDVGIIYKPEWGRITNKTWGLQDLQFGFVMKEIGKPLVNLEQTRLKGYDWDEWSWCPAPFTPAGAVNFNLYNNGTTYWKVLTDLSFPFFQNMTFALGTEVQIMKFITLKGSYTFDLEGTLEYIGKHNDDVDIPACGDIYNIFNFAGGISFKFSSDSFKHVSKIELQEKKYKTNEFSIDIAARPYYDGAIFEVGFTMQFGTKDTEPPKISYNQRDFYVSPNFDGIQDVVEIELDIKDERYVREWRMEISNEAGDIVRVIANKQERTESLSPKAVVKRLFAPKTGVPVPDIIEWDCRDNNGKLLPDGAYTFKFFAMDDNKNQDENGTPAATVYIDTKKPDMKVKLENRIFSPGTDGTKDKLIIDLDIIREQAKQEFIPSFEYGNEMLTDVLMQLPNSDSPEILHRESVNAQAQTDTAKDKKAKKVKKKTAAAEKKKAERVDDGRVSEQTWNVEIRNAANKPVKSFVFNEKGQKRLEWDGRDENGNLVPDGVYKIVLTSRNLAGNSYEEVINNIVIDTQPKPIEVSINRSAFSPNGNSVIKTIDFGLEIPVKDGIELWKLEVLNKDSDVVREFSGKNLPPQTITWDGKDNDGNYLEEGKYCGRLSVLYVNGTIPTGVTPDFVIDITPPDGRVTNYIAVFSPNGDGNKDETIIEQVTTVEEEWRGYIYDESGKTVKSYIWKSQASKKVAWDGKDDSNRLLPDGNYDYQLKAIDLAGNTFESELYRIRIDTENVPLMLTYGMKAFNCNKKSQDFTVIAKSDSEKNTSEWKFGIYNELGNLIYTSKGSGKLPKNLSWDGSNNDGNKVPDGSYSAKIDVVFENGTPSSAKTGMFIIDTVAPQIKIQAVSDVFSPNEDSRIDTFDILQSGSEELSWEEYIYDNDGNVMFHKFYENSKPTAKESWNGKDMNGNLAKNGFYKYVITGRDIAENETTASIDRFELKNVYTSAFLTLSEEMMAPKGKAPYDTIEIIPMVGVKEDISAYKIEILNEAKTTVKIFQGEKSLPEKIVWDGMMTDGKQTADGLYTAKMTVMYRFGNMPTVETPVFKVDSAAPEIKLTYVPEYFSPDNDNVDDELNIMIDSDDLTGIKEWKITVINPQTGKEFTSFSGTGKPTSNIKWNGQNENGEIVESAEDYPVRIYAEDLVGNVLQTEASPIMVDILVIKEADGRLKIKISNIEFKPDSSQMVDSPKNMKVLNMLSKALKKYGSYKITIEGHANKFTEKIDEDKARALSEQRAQVIAARLKKLGISGNRMTAVGRGVDVPLVPFGPNVTKEQLAKNRRVEFYLEK